MNPSFISRFTSSDLAAIVLFINEREPSMINAAVGHLFELSSDSTSDSTLVIASQREKEACRKIASFLKGNLYVSAVTEVRAAWGIGLAEAKFTLDSSILYAQERGFSVTDREMYAVEEDKIHLIQRTIERMLIDTFMKKTT